MRARPELVLTGVTVLWASTFVVTKGIVREVAPLPFLCVRFAIGATLLALIFRKRLASLSRQGVWDGVVLGLLNSTGLVLQVFGQAYTTASKSAFVTSLNTPLVPVVGVLLYGIRPTRPKLVAVILATIGVGLLTWPGAGARWNDGDLLTVGCALLYALTIVEITRRTPRHDALALTVVQVVTAFLLFAVIFVIVQGILRSVPLAHLPEMLRLEARPFAISRHGWTAILYMGVICTVVTFAGQTWAMGKMSATHAAIVFALEPVFATVMAITVDGSAEWPGPRGAAGAVLVMVAVLVSEIRLVRRDAS